MVKTPHRRNFPVRKSVAGLVAACLLAPNVFGYAAPAISEIPDAGKTLRESQQVERKLPERQIPEVGEYEDIEQPLGNPSGLQVFVLNYRVTGQDLFPQDEFDKLVRPYTNKEVRYEEMEMAANQVAKYFRNKGYLVAQAYLPPQELSSGTVEIKVTIGEYGEIAVQNQSSVDENAIRRQLSGLVPGNAVQSSELERAALLVGDLSGITAKITLTPGKKTGTSDVIVEVRDKGSKTDGSLSVNNWGNRFTGSYQTSLNFNVNNVSGNGDNAVLTLASTGSGQTNGNIGWRMPLGEGSSLEIGYSKLRYELGEDFANLNGYGNAHTMHIDWAYSLQRSRSSNLSFQLGYDNKRLDDYLLNMVTSKKSHAVRIGLNGDSVDNLWGGGANGYNVTWYRGSLSGDSDNTTLPIGNWQKVTYSFMRQQYLADRLSGLFSFSGQIANANLDTSERFSLGGATGVRAYPSGEASGDEAWLFSGELRWTLPTQERTITQLTAFYDLGVSHVEKHQTVAGENRRVRAGAGVGVNYIMPGDYVLKAAYAWKTSSAAATSDEDKSGRFWIQATKYF